MLILITAVAVFDFTGGSSAALARDVSQRIGGKPVVIALGSTDKLRAAKFSYETDEQLRSEVRNYFQFALPVEGAFGFGPRAYPKEVLDRALPRREGKPPTIRMEEGKWTVEPKDGEWTPLARLALGSGRSVTVHPFLAEMPVTMAAEKGEPEDALRALAQAVGGRLETGDSWKIVPVVKTVRERWIAGYRALAGEATEPRTILRHAVSAQLLGSAVEKDVADLLDGRKPSLETLAAPGTPIHQLAWNALRAEINLNAAILAQPQGDLSNLLDVRRPVRAEFRMGTGGTVHFLDRQGKAIFNLSGTK